MVTYLMPYQNTIVNYHSIANEALTLAIFILVAFYTDSISDE